MPTGKTILCRGVEEVTKKMEEDLSEIRERAGVVEKSTAGLPQGDPEMLRDLGQRLAKLESEQSVKPAEPEPPSVQVEPAIAEIYERESRMSNILIFGVPEPHKEPREIRQGREKEAVIHHLKLCNGDAKLANIRFHRIGRYSEAGTRPIKVMFPSREEAQQILRYRNNMPRETGVYIKHDLTKLQREALKKLIATLEDRKSKGESNIGIRYLSGVPRIVKIRPVSDPVIKNRQ